MSSYELRIYDAVPGRMADLCSRFREHTLELFTEHGIESLGYWVDAQDANRLVYLLRHSDAEASWASFKDDERWLAVKAASEQSGPLTTGITSMFLTPTAFSSMQ
ncbi:NIPSNAP family protein [Arthrobacter sp. S39]|uniref:NIPSNAP family protein n=1 Tax=Arthrobacter sp. S39 TaxID=2509720 RepID=UPI00103806E0|nr:NIPSNAP family protein [Arthrobacter sp. S39]TAP39570.1 NIPSNAP family protein [Arthrobacter sp. S39]